MPSDGNNDEEREFRIGEKVREMRARTARLREESDASKKRANAAVAKAKASRKPNDPNTPPSRKRSL